MRSALFAVVALIGCSRSRAVEFRRTEFPGFALEAPTTLPPPETGSTYDRGATRMKGERAVYSVSWNTNALPSDALLPTFTKALRVMAEAPDIAPAKRIEIGGAPALRFDGIGGDDFWSLVAVSCGLRTIQIMVHAPHGEPVLARMLDHLECHPIATEEQHISTAAPVGLDDRTRIAGWKRMPDPGAYTITDDTHAASFTKTSGDWHVDLELFAKSVPAGWKLGPTTIAHDRSWATITTPVGSGVAVSWPCDGGGVLGFAIGYDDAAARELLLAFRCPRPGDAPLVAP